MSAADPAPAFAALGDRTRLSLLITLSDARARSIATLCADTQLTRQAVAKHLHVLEHAGLVTSARAGREMRFAFAPAAVTELRACLDTLSRQWEDALTRLDAFLAANP